MKFILNENKKFKLEEKFILKESDHLVEASAVDVAVKWTDTFKETLENTQNVLNKYINFASISKDKSDAKNTFTSVQDNIDKAWSELEISLVMPEKDRAAELFALKAELKAYIDTLKAASDKLKDKKAKDAQTLLTSRITDLSALDSKTEWAKSDIDELMEVHKWVETTLLPLFDTTDIDNDSEKVKLFKQTCKDCLSLIDKITNSLPKSFTDFDDKALRNYIDAMKVSIDNTTIRNADSINKGLVVANIDTYLKQVTILKQNYEKINNTTILNDTRAKVDQEKTAEDRRQGNAWEAIYNDCLKSKNVQEATEKFWNGGLPTDAATANPNEFPVVSEEVSKGYFVKEWGARADFIKSLSPFVTEVLELGWTAIDNPFINYLRQVDNPPLTKEAYIYLHNAYVENIISEKDIRGEGKLGKYNLIFHPGFQSLQLGGLDYLYRQQQIVNNLSKIGAEAKTENLPTILFNVLDERGNLDNPLAKSANITITKLRPINIIDRKLRLIGLAEPEEKINATNEDVTKVLSKFNNSNSAKKALSYLSIEYRKAEIFKELSSKLEDVIKTNLSSNNLSFEDFEELDKFFKTNIKFNKAQLVTLFEKLAQKAGLV